MAESPTEGHPDKLADQIADALLDEFLRKDPFSRVSLEVMVTTGLILIGGEVSTNCYVDIQRVVREVVKDVGYTKPSYGFDADSSGVLISIDEQSPEIYLGISSEGAGDTAVVVGYACEETPSYMPLSITLAHRISQRLSRVRKEGRAPFLRPDGKVLVSLEYEGEKPTLRSLVVYAQHEPDVSLKKLREFIREEVILKELPSEIVSKRSKILINPSGRFVIGGPAADTGLTGRKIVSDAYGDVVFSGGSAFSGKDPTKTDRSGSYMARCIAKHVVAGGFAKRCLVQIGYAFGMSEPVCFDLETFGTEKVSKERLKKAIREVFPLRPSEIIEFLNLRRPLYRKTSVYGHFGKEGLPWEDLKYLEKLKEIG